MYIPALGERPADGSFIAPVEELLQLKALIDSIKGSIEVLI